MDDVQARRDDRRIAIDQVGVSNLRYPIAARAEVAWMILFRSSATLAAWTVQLRHFARRPLTPEWRASVVAPSKA